METYTEYAVLAQSVRLTSLCSNNCQNTTVAAQVGKLQLLHLETEQTIFCCIYIQGESLKATASTDVSLRQSLQVKWKPVCLYRYLKKTPLLITAKRRRHLFGRLGYSFLEKKLSLQLKIYKYSFVLCATEILIHLPDS